MDSVSNENTNTVFVYGTLKKGHGNHRLLERGKAEFVDKAVTRGIMYDLGAFPAVSLHGDHQIHGELYNVDMQTMADLDRLEGHPNFYRRQYIDTNKGKAWMYTMDHDNELQAHRVIKDGVWQGGKYGADR